MTREDLTRYRYTCNHCGAAVTTTGDRIPEGWHERGGSGVIAHTCGSCALVIEATEPRSYSVRRVKLLAEPSPLARFLDTWDRLTTDERAVVTNAISGADDHA